MNNNNSMKKIIGVIMGVGLLGVMAHTAFAELTSTLSGTSDTTKTISVDTTDTTIKTTETQTTTTSVAPATTETTTATPTSVISSPSAPALKAYVVLEGSDAVISGTENVFVKVSREARLVEVGLMADGSSAVYHLGQATFDPENTRWVYAWNSAGRTPDGAYLLIARATAIDGTITRSNSVRVLVRNEKREEAKADTTNKTAPAPASRLATERYIANMQKAKEADAARIRKELAITLKQSVAQKENEQSALEQKVNSKTEMSSTTARPRIAPPVDYEKVINENSQDLKDAIEQGNTKKEVEIVSKIVRVAQGTPEGASAQADLELTKKVEEGVAKLKQVLVDQDRGVVDEQTFKVEAVQVAEVVTKPDGTKTASKIAFRGKALPDSFVTLYIYSIPILVTVKTDSEGNWNYTLDKELEDGSHQVYVGITDVKGKVVVKSNPLPFVKTASAITVEQALAVPEAQAAPSFVQNNYFYGIVTIIIMIVAFVFIFLGLKMSKTPDNPTE